MKKCPQCGTQYSDVTLNFCLDDGTPLVGAAQSDTPTVVLGETDTVLRSSGVAGESQVTHVASPTQPVAKSSNTTTAVAMTIVGMLVLFGVVGVVAFIYFKNSQEPPPRNDNSKPNTNIVVPNTNSYASPVPTVSPMATSTTSMNANLPSPSTPEVTDETVARTEVSQRLSNWKSAMESGDLDGYMSNYAPTVDYYNRSGASISEVRADKARAFARYRSKQVSISNIDIDISGDAATATFDKEWVFSGDGTNSGKVRSQFRFRRIGTSGRWAITGERDVKVYYTR